LHLCRCHYAIAPHGVTEQEVEATRQELARSNAFALPASRHTPALQQPHAAGASGVAQRGAKVRAGGGVVEEEQGPHAAGDDSDESEREEMLEIRSKCRRPPPAAMHALGGQRFEASLLP